jgi:hypothetical protein
MSIKSLLCTVLLATALCAHAQEPAPDPAPAAASAPAPTPTPPPALIPQSPWKLTARTNLTLNLNSYSENWAGGEFSALSWGWQFDGTAERPFTSWLTNKNTLKLAFGQTALQVKYVTAAGAEKKKWQSPSKSSDLIDFESLLKFTLQTYVDPFVAVRMVSQFVDVRVKGYNSYLNPLVLTESFGGVRDLVP